MCCQLQWEFTNGALLSKGLFFIPTFRDTNNFELSLKTLIDSVINYDQSHNLKELTNKLNNNGKLPLRRIHKIERCTGI